MAKKSILSLDERGKRVLMRVNFNVPQDANGLITDDRRIRMALPTIHHILDEGGRLILISHLGRPKGKSAQADRKWTLSPIAKRLEELLGKTVSFSESCVGSAAENTAAALANGERCLLENLRFHEAEQIKDKITMKRKDKRKTLLREGWRHWPIFTSTTPSAPAIAITRACSPSPKR